MAIYGGVDGAVKELYPWGGVSNAKKRILRTKCGVEGAIKSCQIYLDEIDHVEVRFYGMAIWSNISSQGGTLLYEGKSDCTSHGSSISFSGASVTTQFTGASAGYSAYFYFRFYLVLKDGYRLLLSYPYTADGKSVTVNLTRSNWYSSHNSWYWIHCWAFDDFACGSDTGGYTETATVTSSSSEGGIRITSYNAGQTNRMTFTFGPVTIGGVSYSVQAVDAIAE